VSDSYTNESRRNWFTAHGQPTTEQLQLGCLQRIADAVEKMATNYLAVSRERDVLKTAVDDLQRRLAAVRRSQACLRGALTRLKQKGGKS
jgi:hypothetical protein